MMMTINGCRALAAALMLAILSTAAAASPDEDHVLAVLVKAHPNTHFTGVARTAVPDFYEVWMGANVAFVSGKNPRYFIFGRLYDTVAMEDLTAPKLAKAQRLGMNAAQREEDKQTVSFAELPLADAIKTVKGDGSRVMAVFSDPLCPFCKRLAPELDGLDNVTLYTFLLPYHGTETPLAIWCARDPRQAYEKFMLRGDASAFAAAPTCANPLERNLALAQRLGVNGTPTLLFATGGRLEGYTERSVIEARLAVGTAQDVPHSSLSGAVNKPSPPGAAKEKM
jgi:thiol:disulfide interchange protein DsbC